MKDAVKTDWACGRRWLSGLRASLALCLKKNHGAFLWSCFPYAVKRVWANGVSQADGFAEIMSAAKSA